MIETSFEHPSAPIGTQQRADEVENHYDRIQIKEELEQKGYLCTEHSTRFSLGIKGDIRVDIKDFPQGDLIIQPPVDDEGCWQLFHKLITNGPKVFKVGEEEGLDRRTDLEEEVELTILSANSDQEIARLKLIPDRTHLICAIKAV